MPGEPRPQCVLVPQPDGSYLATWPSFTLRFLLSDGRTVDVVTTKDDSDLRGALVELMGVERLEGSTRLKEPPKPPPPQDERLFD